MATALLKGGEPATILARCLRTHDGIDIRTALLRAELAVEMHREAAMKSIHESLSAIVALAPEGAAVRAELAALASEIASVSGLYALTPLGQAAGSLYDLLELLNDGAPWVQNWVDVHVNAMRALASEAPRSAALETALLDGLSDIMQLATLRCSVRTGQAP